MTAAITATSAMAPATSAVVVRRSIPPAFVRVGGGGGGAGSVGVSDPAIRALGLAVTRLPARCVGGDAC
jgi:hypothetical protein